MDRKIISPIDEAINAQKTGFLNPQRPRDMEKLFVGAVDRQEKWLVDRANDLAGQGTGSRGIARTLGISRNRVRRFRGKRN